MKENKEGVERINISSVYSKSEIKRRRNGEKRGGRRDFQR